MSTPEEKYYDAMNTVLAPVRWAKSLLQTIIIALLLVGIGVFYPLYVYLNGDPVTAISFAVPILTILAVVTMFYAPFYFWIGGIAFALTIGMLCEHCTPETNPAMAFLTSGDGWTFAALIFAFLAIGILQKYIRKRLRYNRLSSGSRAEYGTCESAAPSSELPEDETATEDNDEPSKHYSTLGIQRDASPEVVKQAYRDLVKVWHPDRFNIGDIRLRQKAEEQLKTINDAYAHIQEAKSHQQESSLDIEHVPLEEAVNLTTLQFTLLSLKAASVHLAISTGCPQAEIDATLQEFWKEQKEAVAQLETVIRRIQCETAGASTAELESLLSNTKELGAQIDDAVADFRNSVNAHQTPRPSVQPRREHGSATDTPMFGGYMEPQTNGHLRFWLAGLVCLAVILSLGVFIATRTSAHTQTASSAFPAPPTSASQAVEQAVADASAPSTPAKAPAADDRTQPIASASSQAPDEQEIQEAVDRWANAFRGRDAKLFADCYAPTVERLFGRREVSRSRIQDIYQAAFRRIDAVNVYDISDLHITFPDGSEYPSRATATYDKRWDTAETDGRKDSGEEVERLTFEKTDDGWKIAREEEVQIMRSLRQ